MCFLCVSLLWHCLFTIFKSGKNGVQTEGNDTLERKGAKNYNKNDTSYLFDLDFDTELKNTVDATQFGNLSQSAKP